jgi:hypothetical protein
LENGSTIVRAADAEDYGDIDLQVDGTGRRPGKRELAVPNLMATRWSESLHGRWPQDGLEERADCLVCIYPAERLGSIVKLGGD